MNVEKSTVAVLKIKSDGLDTLNVYIEDYEPGKGQITITCFGEAGKLTRSPRTIADYDGIKPMLLKEICERRKNEEFDKKYARELWNEVDCAEFDERLEESDLIYSIMGDDWWHCLPAKPNPDYEYLCEIIEVVKTALKQQ